MVEVIKSISILSKRFQSNRACIMPNTLTVNKLEYKTPNQTKKTPIEMALNSFIFLCLFFFFFSNKHLSWKIDEQKKSAHE